MIYAVEDIVSTDTYEPINIGPDQFYDFQLFHPSILDATSNSIACPSKQKLDSFQVILSTCADDEQYCSEYLQVFNSQMKDLSQSMVRLESNIDLNSAYGRDAVDRISNAATNFLDASRSMMWRALRNKVSLPPLLKNPSLDEMVEESVICSNTAKTTNQLLSYISDLVESLPEYELDTDDTGNIIISWFFDSCSYEWTLAKCDDPWPMVKVYEFSRKRSSDRQPPSVRTWHNAKSLGERFKSIIDDEQQPQHFIEN